MLIPREVFAVSKCAARESTRYAINGVCVERESDGKCRASTTDGRMLVSVSWDDAETRDKFPDVGSSATPVDGFTSIVDREHWNRAARDITTRISEPIRRHSLLDETTANGRADFRTPSDRKSEPNQAEAETIEGHFPKWRDVVPDYDIGVNAIEIGFNPDLLSTLLRAISDAATDAESKGVRLIIPKNPKQPMLIKAHNSEGREAVGVIMPVNLDV